MHESVLGEVGARLRRNVYRLKHAGTHVQTRKVANGSEYEHELLDSGDGRYWLSPTMPYKHYMVYAGANVGRRPQHLDATGARYGCTWRADDSARNEPVLDPELDDASTTAGTQQ